jgi:RNA polymerase sigma-70 factor (ECF subfamily)
MTHDPIETPLSLLDRVRIGDAVAWSEFFHRYLRMLRSWCHKWGLQATDADDLIQDTLLIVMTKVCDFRHRGKGSFRSWIRTIARHCLCEVLSRAARKRPAESLEALWETPAAKQSLEDELDRIFELQLLEQAMTNVQSRVQPGTWAAFQMMAIESLPAKQVAEKLGLRVTAVYASRARVQRLIAEELTRFSEEFQPDTAP